ncbi:MAG: insulinase family protein [Proteobacteria bacterium]|nr:insulinase family protein [Pseudomonadota bacterium]
MPAVLASPDIHHEVLPNGLELLLRPSHRAPVAEFQIFAQVGSADERDGEQGLAHFHEHMLFKGTHRRGVGEIAGDVEGAGGRINAYTSFDLTVYHATLPADALAVGVDVLCDAVRHSLFEPVEIEREIEVVLEEIRRSRDAPGHVLGDALFAEVYRVHPYRSPILGPPESVARFDRERVSNFFRRWYAPDNLVVVAAGAFDPHDLADRIRTAFADAEPAGAKRARPEEPRQQGLRTVLLERPFERVRAELCWASAAFRTADATYLDLLAFVLGECDSSRLAQRVKDEAALVDRVDASSYTPLDPGLFSVSLETDGDRIEAALEASLREVERVRRQEVSEDELERARANFLAIEHFERESVSGLARKLGSFQVLAGDWRKEETYFETIRRATPADLARVAQTYLGPEQLTVGALLPEGAGGVLDEDRVCAGVDRAVSETRRVFSLPRREGSGRDVQSYALEGGLQLHVLPRRDVPVVALRTAFRGGLLNETAETQGLSSFLASMWLRGTQGHSAAGLARAIESLAIDLEGFSGRNSLGLTLEATSEKLDPALDLLAEVLLRPAFDPDEVERERRETLAAIERRQDQLARQAYLLFGEALFPSHPYRLPLLGTAASVSSFSPESLRSAHRQWIAGRGAVIGVAGDVDPDQIAAALSARLADLPAGAGPGALPPEDAPPDAPRQLELQKDRAQAHLVLGWQGLRVDDPDRAALEVIAQLLAGQGGRLFLELRDKQSLAYTVSAVNVEGVAPGFFSVYIASAPDKVEVARSGLLAELERLVNERPPADELASAKRYLVGNFAIDQQRNSARASHIALDALYGLGPEADQDFPAQIEAVEAADVLRVAQRTIRLDAPVEALVRP